MLHHPVVIIGAGPAGLTAAYELTKRGVYPHVLEAASQVGGISRTEVYKGYRFDIGGHRFFTKVDVVNQLWQEVLGDEFIQVPRLSRIYYQNKFYDYPLSIYNTLLNLGVIESSLILMSYLKAKVKAKLQPDLEAETFEEWVTDSFGSRLYRTFFKTYTEKVWGIPCNKIEAEWAAQRIKGLSLKKAVINALFGSNDTKTLIKKFDYPIYGPGMMWERFQQKVDEKGGQVSLNTRVMNVKREGYHITEITAYQDGQEMTITGENFISSMPVTALVNRLYPLPPDEVLHAAKSLSYRDFLIVALIIDEAKLFPDNWIYIHSPEVKVGRIQNFKNWSPAMVPDQTKTCLGLEYFCTEGDEIWKLSDTELLDLATREIEKLGLAKASQVEDGTILRQPKAYPVYDRDYRRHLQVIQDYLSQFDNLQTIGRNGMHRYNNQDHSMLTGLLAAQNLLGDNHDLWNVNTERSYHEEFTKEEWKGREKPELVMK
ncbi:MAG: NAD(P)/FAD-dependent oxidoreductase [Limnoraphis sp.]